MRKTNLVIIGSGPAGYTAAIYSARANLEPVLFEGFLSGLAGGPLMTTTEVENFPGFPEAIFGPDLMERMRKQAKNYKTTFLQEDVVELDLSSQPFIVKGSKTIFETNAVIVATGANPKKLDVPGSKEFWQKGVSTCATCDGALPIFKNKELFVIGGGDSAVEEALFLTRFASKVFIVHRKDTLRASKIMALRATNNHKIEIIWNSELDEILGDQTVKAVVLKNNVDQKKVKLSAGGVFFAIGHSPNTAFLKGQLALNENGYILTKSGSSHTSVKGVFAAGDVQDFVYRQAITAAASGCMAALDAQKWLEEKGHL